ncbi:MAG: alpha/beta hydrolase [Azonexus sp.]|nr:alpha/beta hydrolase [Azonexus sp.]MCK6411647.1 alpha/beta hydrolase [Azonexus sp.]
MTPLMTHFLADDGEKIHLQISGEGTPLILLHGWTSSHQEWFPFLPELNAHHRVYRWDARGHGGHRLAHPGSATVERMARDLKNLIDHYGLENATAVGHSMGALTLWQYLRDHGTHGLGKLCLIDQSPRLLTGDDWDHGIYGDFGVDRNRQLIDWLREDFAEGVLKLTALGLNQRAREKYEANASGWQRSRAALQAQDPEPLIHCWESLTAADYRDVLANIPLPTLLVYGGQSNFYRSETARYVAATIPNAILNIYDGTDHSPHQWQRERFVRELLGFVGG